MRTVGGEIDTGPRSELTSLGQGRSISDPERAGGVDGHREAEGESPDERRSQRAPEAVSGAEKEEREAIAHRLGLG